MTNRVNKITRECVECKLIFEDAVEKEWFYCPRCGLELEPKVKFV